MVDTKTKEVIDKITPKINLNIIFNIALDKYTGLNRQMMEQKNIIKEFWNNKADIMSYALQFENDVIFLDSDIFILDKIDGIDNQKDVGLSPHYIKKVILINLDIIMVGVHGQKIKMYLLIGKNILLNLDL